MSMQHQWLELKVVAKYQEATDIFVYELAQQDGQPLPPFGAGAHIDVQVREGLVRQYSLCNHPQERHRYVIAVLKDPGSRGGSVALHEQVAVGDVLKVSEPKNHFPLAAGAPHSLMFAGGIGVTPILCMAERLAQIGASFTLHYCARSRDRMAFVNRIEKSTFADKVHLHLDDGPDTQKLELRTVLTTARADSHLYVCGPTGFMKWIIDSARIAGFSDELIHREYFGADVVQEAGDTAFEVQLASDGRVFTIPADQTIRQALAAQGVEIPVSCEQGVCGVCLTRVLSGEPDHRDLYLTEKERRRNDQMMPCCSRARSPRLVLDL